MKRVIKRIGRSFIGLRQESEKLIGQSVLIVDNGYSWIGHLGLAIGAVRKYFPKADISILTFQDRKFNLEKDFSDITFVLVSEKLWPRKYRIALQMLMMQKKKYDFMVLLSMDITPLVSSQFFFKSRAVLYNQWGQWWSLSLRKISEIFKKGYIKRETRFSLKNLLKRIGLFFMLVERVDEKILRRSVLLIDNGDALYAQIGYGIQRIKDLLPEARISVLGLSKRKELEYNFQDLENIQPPRSIIAKYQIARHMFKLRRAKYDYIVLLSLDVTPIIVSMFFMKGKKILFNHWKQWWVLEPRPIEGYLVIIPQFIFSIVVLIYLLISVLWIFLKRSFNMFRFGFARKEIQ